jgi:hypothetical protein
MNVSLKKGGGRPGVFLSPFFLCSTIQKGLESQNSEL